MSLYFTLGIQVMGLGMSLYFTLVIHYEFTCSKVWERVYNFTLATMYLL